MVHEQPCSQQGEGNVHGAVAGARTSTYGRVPALRPAKAGREKLRLRFSRCSSRYIRSRCIWTLSCNFRVSIIRY